MVEKFLIVQTLVDGVSKIQFCESVLEMFDKYSRYFTYATLAFETLV